MEIVEWTPMLTYPAHLYITARLVCPFCRTEAEAVTIAQLFHGLPTADGGRIGSTSSSIETVVSDLSKQRACEHCGIISIVPQADRERVLSEAHNMLTTDWFREESERTHEARATLA